MHLRAPCPGTRTGRLRPSASPQTRLFQSPQEQVQAIARSQGVALAHQGWQPSEHRGVGAWVDVEETPQEIEEQIFPLYPLIPDPSDAFSALATTTSSRSSSRRASAF